MAEPTFEQHIKSLENCFFPGGECVNCSFDVAGYPECEQYLIRYTIEKLKGGDSNDQASVSPK